MKKEMAKKALRLYSASGVSCHNTTCMFAPDTCAAIVNESLLVNMGMASEGAPLVMRAHIVDEGFLGVLGE
jgi:hypothetical protein